MGDTGGRQLESRFLASVGNAFNWSGFVPLIANLDVSSPSYRHGNAFTCEITNHQGHSGFPLFFFFFF